MIEFASKLGYAMDALRLWPRIFLALWGYGLARSLLWYWHMPPVERVPEVTAFVSLYTVLGAPMFKWYVENGVDWAVMLPMVWKRFREKAPNATRV